MLAVGGAGQGLHTDLQGEAEDELRGGSAEAGRQPGDLRMPQLGAVRRQQREALVDDAALAAEGSDLGIPPGAGKAAVLDEVGLPRTRAQLLELIEP